MKLIKNIFAVIILILLILGIPSTSNSKMKTTASIPGFNMDFFSVSNFTIEDWLCNPNFWAITITNSADSKTIKRADVRIDITSAKYGTILICKMRIVGPWEGHVFLTELPPEQSFTINNTMIQNNENVGSGGLSDEFVEDMLRIGLIPEGSYTIEFTLTGYYEDYLDNFYDVVDPIIESFEIKNPLPSEYDIILSLPSPGPSPQGLAWDGEYLWVSDDSTDTIYKIRPTDGYVVSSFDFPGSDVKGLAWDGTNLWAVDGTEVTIYKLNPANGDSLSSIHLDIYHADEETVKLSGIAWDGSHLFYSYFTINDDIIEMNYIKESSYFLPSKIQRINPQNKEIDDDFCFAIAQDLTYDGTSLWYTTWTSFKGLVKKREMPYKNWTAHFWTPGYSPTGLTWDGAYLWLAEDEADSLYKIEVKMTEVKESLQVPVSFDIKQNYPNPFNPSTTISYFIPEQGYVRISVYNITGSKIATLVDKPMSAGSHSVKFDGSDLGSGVYFYRLESKGFTKMGKMLLMK